MTERIRAWAPGRVNLIGEHTDYTGGLVLPMAIHLGTTVAGEVAGGRVALRSDAEPDPVEFDLPLDAATAAAVTPSWGRHVAGVAAVLGSEVGVVGTVSSTVPLGSGLSSSAALEVASALALGASGTPAEVAAACQRGSQVGTGVPCGIMDQLASAAGVEGHALRIDCRTLEVRPVPFPDDVDVVVVHSGQHRELASSAYGERRAQCEAAEAVIGPLRDATAGDLDRIEDPLVRARARHVISENLRVDAFAAALDAGDGDELGRLLTEGHASLRDDFAVSTPVIEALVARLTTTAGVLGARITGAGFGGCVVALCRPGVDPTPPGLRSWRVRPGPGAHLA